MSDTSIYWFRDDLRLSDLPGLTAAAANGPVVPVYVRDLSRAGEWIPGGASDWWLHHSLASLQRELAERSAPLVLRTGDAVEALTALAVEVGASTVFCSRQYQPWAGALEKALRARLNERNVALKRFPGTLLHEPEDVATGSGTPFKVFTPFWRACLRRPEPAPTLPIPALTGCNTDLPTDMLSDWGLIPEKPNWAAGWETLWTPGEAGAEDTLETFLSGHVKRYGNGRDIPAEPNTSKLSPFLRQGNISPRQVWHAAQASKLMHRDAAESIDKFLSEIGWREFCYHLLFHFPSIPDEAFNQKFAFFPWGKDASRLAAWKRGQTGYPIVDAGMRELWQTGFMHNRVRMVVASFLTKHLLLNWREGERWFWDCLLDADLASNACSWQWVGGSGADAAPYFRIFNPIAQGEKFDKTGEYTRHWVPELGQLPDKYLHKPWEAPLDILTESAVILGDTYPRPIVDHKTARETALAAYATLKEL
ncbi:MAG: deoxyribodipyrimidine photo-lyase [Luminiphilus sp.]|nr:deoxyribodipyrimidine photo-lyase [Luminiphilus sp.]